MVIEDGVGSDWSPEVRDGNMFENGWMAVVITGNGSTAGIEVNPITIDTNNVLKCIHGPDGGMTLIAITNSMPSAVLIRESLYGRGEN